MRVPPPVITAGCSEDCKNVLRVRSGGFCEDRQRYWHENGTAKSFSRNPATTSWQTPPDAAQLARNEVPAYCSAATCSCRDNGGPYGGNACELACPMGDDFSPCNEDSFGEFATTVVPTTKPTPTTSTARCSPTTSCSSCPVASAVTATRSRSRGAAWSAATTPATITATRGLTRVDGEDWDGVPATWAGRVSVPESPGAFGGAQHHLVERSDRRDSRVPVRRVLRHLRLPQHHGVPVLRPAGIQTSDDGVLRAREEVWKTEKARFESSPNSTTAGKGASVLLTTW